MKCLFLFVGSNSKIVNKPIMEDDPQRRKPDISRAKATLGWEPVVSVFVYQYLVCLMPRIFKKSDT